MKYLVILLITITLGACDTSKDTMFSEDKDRSKYEVEYETLDSFDEVNARYEVIWDKQKNPIIEKATEGMYGFSYDEGSKCIIVMAKPSQYSLKELERTLGHEHLHCRFGAWHK